MENESHIAVDRRALTELRSRVLQSEAVAEDLRAELDRLSGVEEELQATREGLEQTTSEFQATQHELGEIAGELRSIEVAHREAQEALATSQTERERIREELDVAIAARDDLRNNAVALTEALRTAQARYWDASRELTTVTDQLVEQRATLESRNGELADMKLRYKRITTSRAWRAISVYRRAINRVRRRQQ